MTKPLEPPPEFFVDRSLGRHIVPDAIRALRFTVHAMADVYPDGDDQRVSDTQWITEADERAWVVLTKDERITRRADEQEALTNSRLRVFAIGNQHLTGPTMANYSTANLHRMVQRARKPGPFVDIVYPDRIERRWPR